MLHFEPHTTPCTAVYTCDEGLYFGGAAVLSSSFDNFLKSFQANYRPEIGSNTLRLDVFVPKLNGPSIGGELPLDPFLLF